MIEQHSIRRRFLRGLALSTAMCAMHPIVFAAESTSAPETILFLGDSITAAGGYVRAIDAALKQQNPEKPYRCLLYTSPSPRD